MAIGYGITCLVLAPPGIVEISKEEFEELCHAKQSVVVAASMEEKFDVLLENYREFEHDLLDLALGQMVSFDLSWESFRFDVQRVNRRVANLLSAARSYLDQTQHQL